jgi:hypothetical protein
MGVIDSPAATQSIPLKILFGLIYVCFAAAFFGILSLNDTGGFFFAAPLVVKCFIVFVCLAPTFAGLNAMFNMENAGPPLPVMGGTWTNVATGETKVGVNCFTYSYERLNVTYPLPLDLPLTARPPPRSWSNLVGAGGVFATLPLGSLISSQFSSVARQAMLSLSLVRPGVRF